MSNSIGSSNRASVYGERKLAKRKESWEAAERERRIALYARRVENGLDLWTGTERVNWNAKPEIVVTDD